MSGRVLGDDAVLSRGEGGGVFSENGGGRSFGEVESDTLGLLGDGGVSGWGGGFGCGAVVPDVMRRWRQH